MSDTKFLIQDTRGAMRDHYLVDEKFPALWSPWRVRAKQYTAEQVAALEASWPYLTSCRRIVATEPMSVADAFPHIDLAAFTREGKARASDLGFPDGYWPARITVRGIRYDLVTFVRSGDGDVRLAEYRRPVTGDKLEVFND